MLFYLLQVKGDMTSYSNTQADGADVMSRLAEVWEGAGKTSEFTSNPATSEGPVLNSWLAGSFFKWHPRQHEVPLHGLSHNKIKLSDVREDNLSFLGPVGNDNLLPNICKCWHSQSGSMNCHRHTESAGLGRQWTSFHPSNNSFTTEWNHLSIFFLCLNSRSQTPQKLLAVLIKTSFETQSNL